MRRLMLAVAALALVLTAHGQIVPQGTALELREYDLSFLADQPALRGSDEWTTRQLDSGEHNPYWFEQGPERLLVVQDEYAPPPQFDLDSVYELLSEVVRDSSAVHRGRSLNLFRNGRRWTGIVVAEPGVHRELGEVLSMLRELVHARVTLEVRQIAPQAIWLGTTHGRPGETLVFSDVRSRVLVADSFRPAQSEHNLYTEQRNEGLQITLWVAVLPDGKLRVHGRVYEQDIKGTRRVGTQAGTLEMAEFTSRYQPVLAETENGGTFTVTARSGREFEIRVSSSAGLPNREWLSHDGRRKAVLNLSGVLRCRYSTHGFGYVNLREGRGGMYHGDRISSVWTDLLEERPELTDLHMLPWAGGFVQMTQRDLGESTADRARLAGQWDALMKHYRELASASPAKFRVRAWETGANGESLLTEGEFASFDYQPTGWHDMAGTEYAETYGFPVAMSAPRQVVIGCAVWGEACRLVRRGDEVQAVLYLRQPEGPIRQLDTRIEDEGRIILEQQAISMQELRWHGSLKPGETLWAAAPAKDGNVIRASLTRVE
jgi:hypothetical protein